LCVGVWVGDNGEEKKMGIVVGTQGNIVLLP